MARKPSSPEHQWINACTLKADHRTAAIGNRLGRVTVEVDTVVDVIDVYCMACRRTYDDVVGQPCAVAVSNQHLIGGATGTRKRRVHDHDCHLFGCILTEAEAAQLRRAAANPPRHRVG